MENNPEVSVVATSVRLIDHEGRPCGAWTIRDEHQLLRTMRWKNIIPHSSVLMRRSHALKVGLYRSEAHLCEDYDLWLRIAAQGSIGVIKEELTSYRIHSNQTSRMKKIPKLARNTILSAKLNLARSEGNSTLMARIRHCIWSMRQILRVKRQ